MELHGTSRLVVSGASTCNVLESDTSYEEKQANHGVPLDVYRLDFEVRNGTGRWLNRIIASYEMASEWPACTNWSQPEGLDVFVRVDWAGAIGTIQETGRNVVAPGARLTETRHLIVLRGDPPPRFAHWSLVDFELGAAGPAAGDAGADPQAIEAALGLDRPTRRQLQLGLQAAGLAPGGADGLFGPRTRAAIRQWQSSQGASATGYLTGAQVAALRMAGASPALASAAAGPPAPAAGAELEGIFWQSVMNSTNPAELEAYLAQFPNGVFRALAEARLAALRSPAATGSRTAAGAPAGGAGPRPSGSRVGGASGSRVAAAPSPGAGAAGGADARPQPGEVFRDCDVCPEMVVVPAGTFLMGSDPRDDESDDDERPRRRVTVSSFALGVREVTRDEYATFVAATGRGAGGRCWALGADHERWGWRSEASWRAPGYPQAGDHPVVCVNWDDAQAYLRWLSTETGAEYRLPSEAEWEHAARAGTTTRRHWGDDPDEQCVHANGADRTAQRRFASWTVADCEDGMLWTSLVGALRANGFGLHDMLGNVWEWVADCWHDDYDGAPPDGTAWTRGGDCSRRALRGGSWDSSPGYLRSTNRSKDAAALRFDDVGFRVARTR